MLVGVQETVTDVIVGAATMAVPEPPPPHPANRDDKIPTTASQTGQPQGFPEPKVRTKVTIAASLLEIQSSRLVSYTAPLGGANPLDKDQAGQDIKIPCVMRD